MTLDWLRQRQSAKWAVFDPDVLPAWVAEMDFPLAEPVAAALRHAVDISDLGYRSERGLGEALSEYAGRQWQWQPDPRLVQSVGDVLAGVAAAIEAFTTPSDAVVIMPPVYPPFFSTVRDVTRRALVEVPLVADENGRATFDRPALELAFARADVTACVLCSPHNPTGTVFTREELSWLAGFAKEHGVTIISDEIHAPLVLPGASFVPYLDVAGQEAHAVCVGSASKGWNVPGLKCAHVVGTRASMPRFREATSLEVIYGAGHLGVLAAIAAYREGQAWLDQVVQVVDANMAMLDAELAARLPQAGFERPQASYLAWIDLRAFGLGDDPAKPIMEHGRLAVNAGPTFGDAGRGHVRVNAGTSPAIMEQIIDRLVTGVQAACA